MLQSRVVVVVVVEGAGLQVRHLVVDEEVVGTNGTSSPAIASRSHPPFNPE
jgi:hypothetical protein